MANPAPPTAPVCTASPLYEEWADEEQGDGANTLAGTRFAVPDAEAVRKTKIFEGLVADMAEHPDKVGVVGRSGGRACVRVRAWVGGWAGARVRACSPTCSRCMRNAPARRSAARDADTTLVTC